MLRDAREEQGGEVVKLTRETFCFFPDIDIPAALVLIHAGISYLILRSKTAETYAGIDLHSEAGWKRVGNGIQSLIKALVAADIDSPT